MLKLTSVNFVLYKKFTGKLITVSTDILKKAGLRAGQSLTLYFGNRTVNTVIGWHGNKPVSTVMLSEAVRDSLLLPAPVLLNIIPGQEPGSLKIGPILAIFAHRTGIPSKPFGEQTGYFTKLHSAAERLDALCFVFCPEDIDWQQKIIRGTIPAAPDTRTWKTTSLPFPDAVYDRGLFPKGAKRKAAYEARKVLRNYPGLKFFNPAFFGKWKTHRLLSAHEVLKGHLPETRLFTSVRDVTNLLSKYKTVFLKPCGGSSGRGILRLSENGDGWLLDYRIAKQIKTMTFKDINQLMNTLLKITGNNRYIVQQGLNLAKTEDCPMDIRVLMQKDISGGWLRTGMAVRVAGRGNYISNLHAGGHASRISQLLPLIFSNPRQVQAIRQTIARISTLIASWVSSVGNPLFGEIAVDLGIDTDGRVWIIELNAIPGRSVFRRIKAPTILSRAISRPMEYACYLSGFAPEKRK